MFPILQIGPLAIQVPGLVIIVGLWFGLTLSERRAKKRGQNPNVLYNLVFIAIISGVIGARLAYVLSYPDAFAENPSSLILLIQVCPMRLLSSKVMIRLMCVILAA